MQSHLAEASLQTPKKRRRWPSCFWCCAILCGLASRCSRDANPHRMANAIFLFFLILALCHSVRVGVPLFTGHQPSQNGQRLLFFGFSCFSPSSCLISRPSEKSRMRCPDQGGRESWDWAEQKSLYKKNSPHKVGEETFVRMGARWRKQSGSSPR